MPEERKPNAPKDWDVRFLAAFRKNGNVSQAAKSAKVTRAGVYARLKMDGEFAAAMEDAQEEASDALEAEALRRAVTGTLRPVFQGGIEVGTVRQYSDTLLLALLKANRPEKFRERTDVTSGGQAIKAYIGFDTEQV